MPRSGQLKEVIDWYVPERTQTPGKQTRVRLLLAFRGCRARVVENRGREDDRRDTQVPVHTHRIEFHSRTVPVKPDWVAVWVSAGGERMEVKSVAGLTDANTDFDVAYTNTIQDATELVVPP